MRYCTNCGHSIGDNAKFCTNCGEAVGTQSISEDVSINDRENQRTSAKAVICSSCGEKVSSADMTCKYCGAPINADNAADVRPLEEAMMSNTVKVSKRRAVLIITAAAMAAVAAIAIFLTTTSGNLKYASIVASFGSYDHAKEIVDDINSSDTYVDLYRNYYGMMACADEIVWGNSESFGEKYDQAVHYSAYISDMSAMLKDSEKVKYNNMVSAFDNYGDKQVVIGSIERNLSEMSEVAEQVEYFKSGDTYAPESVHEKAQEWGQKLEDANSAYAEILPGEEMPHYNTVRMEITKMMNDMKNSEYYGETNVYYKVYENDYTNPYTETEIDSILEGLTDKVRSECRDKIEHIL